MDWLDVLKDELKEDLVSQFAGVLGESPASTQKAVDGAVPAILDELVDLAGSDAGRRRVYQAAEVTEQAGMGNLVAHLAGGHASSVAESGAEVLGSLLDADRGEQLVGALQQYAGFEKPESSGGLLAMLVPFVMSWLGRTAKKDGLDAGGLAGMLLKNKDLIAKLVPIALGAMLKKGRGSGGGSARSGGGRSGGGLGRMLPILVLAAGAFFLWKTCTPSTPPPADEPPRAEAPTEAPAPAPGGASVIELSDALRTVLLDAIEGGDIRRAEHKLRAIDRVLAGAIAAQRGRPAAEQQGAREAVTEVVADLARRHLIKRAYDKPGGADALGPVVESILLKLKAFVR